MIASPPIPLPDLLDRLDTALGPDITSGAWLLRVEGSGADMTVGLLALECETAHPIDGLVGLRGGPTWTAAGLIVHGIAHQLGCEDLSSAPVDKRCSAAVAPARIRAIYAIDRNGREESVLRRFDGSGRLQNPGCPEGRLTDCCRRILGLATAAAQCPPLHWYATRWLSSVLAWTADHPAEPLSWPALTAAHPLSRASRSLDAAHFAARVAADLDGITWESLRAMVAADRADRLPRSHGGAHETPPIAPEVAAWMDDGMFARWLAGDLPDPIDLLIDLAGLLPNSTIEPLVAVLEAWEMW